ncbi:MAG: hypothetical protein GX559_01870 [Candidatus Pacebacteria bacterium]|nr:hypothetical protein [Candidatus Paceibacterota bacterium]
MTNFFKKVARYSLLILLPVLFLIVSIKSPVQASGEANIHFFSSQYCPHCRQAENFLRELKTEQPSLLIYKYEVSHQQNSQLLTTLASRLAVSGQGVPFILINKQSIIGFSEGTASEIYSLLNSEEIEEDFVAEIIKENRLTPIIEEITVTEADPTESEEDQAPTNEDQQVQEIELPVFGRVNPHNISLPIVTIMIGLVDGFNPCAMWVLIFLISLLLGMKDRRRMWALGLVFILTSGFVYFLFMSAWLNFFLFLGLVNWVRIAIALLAIIVAINYLRDFIKNKDAACQVDLGGNKKKIFTSLKEIVYRKNIIWSLLGIILLAFSVNLLELVCSAGLPAVYTKLLSMHNLTKFEHYSYLLLYILVFMLDDVLVFVITMISMKRVTLSTKYAHYAHLVGGIMMLIIGLLMLFKPEWIMFA